MIATMVSFAERMALRQHLSMNYTGQGDCVEIGAFAGACTVAIAQGILDSRHSRKLHVYDVFKFPKGGHEDIYRKLLPGMKGESFRAAFDFQTREFRFMLDVVEGDASEAVWLGGGIEFMHIDCSVSQEFHEKVALEFYPRLIHGAVIAHQDYGYTKAPFIEEMMLKLEPWFRRIMVVDTTAYFACIVPIERDQLSAALEQKAVAA